MNTLESCEEALKKGVSLSLVYNGVLRNVEIHAVGISKAGNLVARVYQLSAEDQSTPAEEPQGRSISHNETGWKLLTLSKADQVQLTGILSQAPRPGYVEGDKDMVEIVQQLKVS